MTSIDEISWFHLFFLIYRLFFLALFSASKQKSEKWVAVSYGRDLRYIGRVVKEDDQNITVIFLERRTGGYFQLRRTQEEVETRQVFMRDVVVNWVGVGRFEVPQEKELRKHHADFWKTSRLREKVQLINTRARRISRIAVAPIDSSCSLTRISVFLR